MTEGPRRRSRDDSARMRIGRMSPPAAHASRFFLARNLLPAGGAPGLGSHRVFQCLGLWNAD
jgi:hypothetical protein